MTGLLFNDPGYKSFTEGWDKWVKGHTREYPDVYWDAAAKSWETVTSDRVTQLSVPKVEMPFGTDFGLPSFLYPDVKHAADLLVAIYGTRVDWNPRTGGWVLTSPPRKPAPPPPPPIPCEASMREELKAVDRMYREGTLLEEEWRGRRRTIIERCLGPLAAAQT